MYLRICLLYDIIQISLSPNRQIENLQSYKLIGVVKLFNSICGLRKELSAILSKRRQQIAPMDDNNQNDDLHNFSHTCPLCLDELMSPSCGPCGHVFCWKCLLQHVVVSVCSFICLNIRKVDSNFVKRLL